MEKKRQTREDLVDFLRSLAASLEADELIHEGIPVAVPAVADLKLEIGNNFLHLEIVWLPGRDV